MSASKDKKRRQGERISGMTESRAAREAAEQAKTMKKYRIVGIIVAVFIVIALALAVIFSTGGFYRNAAAVYVNGQKYSIADFNYFYFAEYNAYSQEMQDTMGEYARAMMPDNTVSLRKQIKDEKTGETWAEFFGKRTVERMTNIAMLCDEAEAEGFTLSEDGKASVESQMSGLSLYAQYYGYPNVLQYLETMCGRGMTEEIYRANLEKVMLAKEYADKKQASFTYDDSTLMNYYNEHEEDYDYLNYRSFFISGDEETGAGSMEKAKLAAEAFRSKVTDEESFVEQSVENANENSKKYYSDPSVTLQVATGKDITSSYRDWLLDPARKYGDIEVFEYESGDGDDGESSVKGYHIVFFIERDKNDYASMNGSFLLVAAENVQKGEDQTDEEYMAARQEADKTASDKANEILSAWNEKKDEYKDFEALSAAFSGEVASSGAYDQAGKNDMPAEVAEWFMDPARKQGDTASVRVDYEGYYIVKFDGRGEQYNKVLAGRAIRENEYSAWADEKEAAYTVSDGWAMGFTKKIIAFGG